MRSSGHSFPANRAMTRAGSLFLLLAALLFAASPSSAQTESLPADQPVAGATPGGTDDGASSDAELWRQIRQGASGTVVGQNKTGGRLIQSDGHFWQQTRNGPLAMYSAWVLLGTIMMLAIFFLLRGRVKIDSGISGITIRRFSSLETTVHWTLATSFIILALTGLNLLFGRHYLLPLIGPEAFHVITGLGKVAHNYVGFAFILSLIAVFVLWVIHNIPGPLDIVWLARGGGLFGGGHPPARKFNAGQKMIFWSVILWGAMIAVSGWALLNPFTTSMFSGAFGLINSVFGTEFNAALSPIQEQQYQQILHTGMAILLIAIVIAHMYIGSIGMQGAAGAMTHGEVDLNWAREHHSLWVEEVEERETGSTATTPAE